jgi:transcriptional regulator with XRE-family HTH domain
MSLTQMFIEAQLKRNENISNKKRVVLLDMNRLTEYRHFLRLKKRRFTTVASTNKSDRRKTALREEIDSEAEDSFSGTSEGGFGREQLRAVGHRLRQLRETRSWSLKDLASKSGVSVAAIQKIETGTANTSLMTVFALSEALGEPMDSLVRASMIEARTTKVVHVAIPRKPINGFDLTGRLSDARVKGRLVVLGPKENRIFTGGPDTSPMFVYVMEGKFRITFADGQDETLGTGDAMHLSLPEHMTWSNAFSKSAQMLCTTDLRNYPDLQGKGAFD